MALTHYGNPIVRMLTLAFLQYLNDYNYRVQLLSSTSNKCDCCR